MIPKSTIEHIVVQQRKSIHDRPLGYLREMHAELPYLTDRALLIGGMRHSGRETLLIQLYRNEYSEAWYADFDDPRLVGFDGGDFAKLSSLIEESGKGVLLFNKIDQAPLWRQFLIELLSKGYKIVATLSLAAWMEEAGRVDQEHFILKRSYPFSYKEFIEATHRRGGESDVYDFMVRGSLPEQAKMPAAEQVRQLYETIIAQDVLVAKGVRDRVTLQRVALSLLSSSGTFVTANSIRNKLKVKAVSTVSEHLEHLEQAGLIRLVSLLSDNPARQAVNPRRVYATDTAFVSALSLQESGADKELLFNTMVFNHLDRICSQIYYTTEAGGCDFVVYSEGGSVACVQTCLEEDYDRMQEKKEGLLSAMERLGLRRGVIVTLNQSETLTEQAGEIQILDADYFLADWTIPV